jgi:hypothetical protein
MQLDEHKETTNRFQKFVKDISAVNTIKLYQKYFQSK